MGRTCAVLLHGLLCDEVVWDAQRQALDFSDCVVPLLGARTSITSMAQHVLETVPAQRFALAGHSMGGRVALEIVRLAPERVERLALLDTGMDALVPGVAGEEERSKRLALLQLAQQHGMRHMGQTWARGMVHPSVVDTPLFEQVLDMIERQTPAIFEAQITALLERPDARSVLQAVQCPTLLLCGRQDAWSPLARHAHMQQLIPGAELVVIEDSGHMSTMEQPAAVSDALKEWMQR